MCNNIKLPISIFGSQFVNSNIWIELEEYEEMKRLLFPVSSLWSSTDVFTIELLIRF